MSVSKVTDKLLDRASVLIREYDEVSISTMQRGFALGYTMASELIEQLETRGLITRTTSVKYKVNAQEARPTP